MALLSEKQQRDLLILAGLGDLLVGGKLTGAAKKVIVGVLRKAVPVAARGAAAFVPRVAATAGMVAMRHPYVTGPAVIYVAIKERDQIRSMLEQGYDIVEEHLPSAPSLPSFPTIPSMPGIPSILPPSVIPSMPIGELLRRPRRKSAFNKAVGAGMSAVKKSKSYGGIGKINPATKVFSMVTKLASAKKKKKKAPKKGIRRKIWAAMGRYV